MRFKKTTITGGLIIVFNAAMVAAKAHYDSLVYRGYTPNQPIHYVERSSVSEDSYFYNTFTFESVDGNLIPVSAALPKNQTGPFPTIIMLYGVGQKMTFLKDIAAHIAPQGFAIYMMEQHQRGERREKNTTELSNFLGLRERATLNMVETRRLVDTLITRPEVDSQRLFLWGISYGTITGVPTFSKEPRFKGAIFTIGGGDIYLISTGSKVYEESGMADKIASTALAYYMSPTDPLLYTDTLTGRPLLFQNALQDQIIPRGSAEALHNAAGEPKQITWYDTDHEGTINNQTMNFFKDGITWLEKQNKKADDQ